MEAKCCRVCPAILVDHQCLRSIVHTAHWWSWDWLVETVHDYERKQILYTNAFEVCAAGFTT